MEKTVLILADGTELSSGDGTAAAVASATITDCVNTEQELTLGAVCAGRLEAVILAPDGPVVWEEGSQILAFREDEAGQRRCMGSYLAEKQQQISANRCRLVAYDPIVHLDKDLSQWLAQLDGWPYSLLTFGQMVCAACGLTLITEDIPNGAYPVQKFSASGVTGRRLMGWVGEACGRFCRATPQGAVELAWYQQADIQITPDGSVFYFQNTLQYADYTVAPIEKVHIRREEADVGVVYPNASGEKNTYVIEGNPLLTAETAAPLTAVAQTIYQQLREVHYTPGSISVPAHSQLRAGSVVQITDTRGKSFSMYVMESVTRGQTVTLHCTGSQRRGSSTAVNGLSYQSLSGKLFRLQQGVDGLQIQHRDTDDRMAALSLDVEGISAEVSSVSEKQLGQAASHKGAVQFTAMGDTGIYPTPYITAYQGGSGEASPENVRPISGADSLEVTVCAENLLRYADVTFTQSKGIYLGTPLAPGTYIFGAFCTSTDTDSNTSGVRFMQGETILATHQLARGRMQYITVTITETTDRIVLYAANVYGTGAGDSATFTDIQLYDASDSKTEAVQLPGTFYGGYVDWAKGKYIQTHQLLVLNGTESLSAFKDNGTTCEAYRYLVDKSLAYGVCNMLSRVGQNADMEGFGQHTNGLSFIMKINKSRLASASVEGIKAWLAERYAEGTPVTFVYELKEPIVYDLGVLPALLARDGVNTVFHNGNGALTVSYNHDGALLDRLDGVHQAALEGDSAVLAEFQEKNTQLLLDAEAITMAALEHYAKTSSLEELRRTLKAELEVWAGGISGRVSKTETDIQNVDGDLQEKFNQITKYFTFDINGMTIGQVDNPNKVVIDNDEISILVNGVAVQRFDADGNALIPSLSVTGKLNLLGLQAEADATHINFDIVG